MSPHWVPSHGSVVRVEIGFRTEPGTGMCSTCLRFGQALLWKSVFRGRLVFCPPGPLQCCGRGVLEVICLGSNCSETGDRQVPTAALPTLPITSLSGTPRSFHALLFPDHSPDREDGSGQGAETLCFNSIAKEHGITRLGLRETLCFSSHVSIIDWGKNF